MMALGDFYMLNSEIQIYSNHVTELILNLTNYKKRQFSQNSVFLYKNADKSTIL